MSGKKLAWSKDTIGERESRTKQAPNSEGPLGSAEEPATSNLVAIASGASGIAGKCPVLVVCIFLRVQSLKKSKRSTLACIPESRVR